MSGVFVTQPIFTGLAHQHRYWVFKTIQPEQVILVGTYINIYSIYGYYMQFTNASSHLFIKCFSFYYSFTVAQFIMTLIKWLRGLCLIYETCCKPKGTHTHSHTSTHTHTLAHTLTHYHTPSHTVTHPHTFTPTGRLCRRKSVFTSFKCAHCPLLQWTGPPHSDPICRGRHRVPPHLEVSFDMSLCCPVLKAAATPPALSYFICLPSCYFTGRTQGH